MLNTLLLAIPFFRGDYASKPVFVSMVIMAVSITAFVTWVVLMTQLVMIADGKRTRNWYMIWAFLVPYLNIFWVPWALISSNSMSGVDVAFPNDKLSLVFQGTWTTANPG